MTDDPVRPPPLTFAFWLIRTPDETFPSDPGDLELEQPRSVQADWSAPGPSHLQNPHALPGQLPLWSQIERGGPASSAKPLTLARIAHGASKRADFPFWLLDTVDETDSPSTDGTRSAD